MENFRPSVCYDCGHPAKALEQCSSCGGFNTGRDRAKITVRPVHEPLEMPWPWENLTWISPAVMLLTGGAGSGKSSLCALLKPSLYYTTEQTPAAVDLTFRRIHGHNTHSPTIVCISSLEGLNNELSQSLLPQNSLIVLDSVTEIGHDNIQVKAIQSLIKHAQSEKLRVIVISQINKKGQSRGKTSLGHLVDITAEILIDSTGQRRLSVTKNRHGSTFTSYFTNDHKGINPPKFRYCYSVEGSPGRYKLSAFPSNDAQWDGLIRKGGAAPGTASAARLCDLYSSGFLEPDDAEERQRFAESHGLKWVPAVKTERAAS